MRLKWTKPELEMDICCVANKLKQFDFEEESKRIELKNQSGYYKGVNMTYTALKEKYKNTQFLTICDDVELDPEMFNTPEAPLGFKRHSFEKGEYAVSAQDFYGNVVVSTDNPHAMCFISLNLIWRLIDKGFDRYETVLAIKASFQNAKNEKEAMQNLKRIWM